MADRPMPAPALNDVSVAVDRLQQRLARLHERLEHASAIIDAAAARMGQVGRVLTALSAKE